MTNAIPAALDRSSHAVRRLASLASLGPDDLAVLQEAVSRTQSVAARRDLVAAGSLLSKSLLIIEGWAYRSCLLADGRRQIIQMILPGDVIHRLPEECTQPHSVIAMTDVILASLSAPTSDLAFDGIEKALAVSQVLHSNYLCRQITRLGRMSALERIVDWLLEVRERLEASGQCAGDTFPLPLTQEAIADALGLTSVHVNRTLMALRRDDLVRVGGGRATIVDRGRCELLVGSH